MDKKTSDVITQVRLVAEETGLGGRWTRLCEELNKRGLRSVRGKEWKPNTLQIFCEKYEGQLNDFTAQEVDKEEPPQDTLATQDTTSTEPHEQVDIPHDTTSAVQVETPGQEPIPQSTTLAPQPETPDSPPETPQLDPETVAVLREVAVWWKSNGAEMAMRNVTWEDEPASPAYRPSFPGKRKNTGIRINEKLLKDALERAKTSTESVKTGGGISPLIEYLLWQYLGFDGKYLQG